MIFTYDTEDALRAAVWLVNTAEDPESMADAADEEAFLGAFPYTGRIDRDDAEAASLRALRPGLREMLLAPRDEMAERVNDALASVTLAPRLTRHGELDWHLHAIVDDAPLSDRVLVETAMALIDVIRADEGSRISVCADDTCDALALDLSRNRSKRYCSTTCANRNAVAAYRARRSEP
ncbi:MULTISPECIES: CGNR zinc finger domain-containing protein [unclassified Microbacterium]|uniref:CGNR zinc finger domain-containing protein n=1 Tax=unclassified Microbacterium TaxID=2609290 RepID=UPI000CFAA98E|nr:MULTISPECIES: CGNR zinc finger domain-containing protein [unclassified Microbacterium]PRB04065.1 RNA-binding protein [Microbacterium sp. MYb72]